MSPLHKPNGLNQPQASLRLLQRLPLALILGLALAGCGGEATTMVTPQSSYTTTTPYTDSYYYTDPTTLPTTGTPYVDTTLPVTVDTPLPTETQPTTPSDQLTSGVEVKLASKELPGILSWQRCEAQILVKNHDATPQEGFLLARFTLKGKEVEMQYKVLSLTAKGSMTFTMKSSVRADDVSLEYRTKLF